jgi:hypothetical protein
MPSRPYGHKINHIVYNLPQKSIGKKQVTKPAACFVTCPYHTNGLLRDGVAGAYRRM